MRVRQGLRALGVAVEQRHAREPGKDLARELQVHVSLAAAAHDPDRLHRCVRERPDPEHAGRRGARLGDPGGVHHRERPAGGRLGEHEQAVDVGQAELLVVGIARDPLDAHRVDVGQVRGHRVDERVLARVHADLGRHLDLARPLRAKRRLQNLDHLETGEPDGLDVRAAEIADARPGHSRSVVGLG